MNRRQTLKGIAAGLAGLFGVGCLPVKKSVKSVVYVNRTIRSVADLPNSVWPGNWRYVTRVANIEVSDVSAFSLLEQLKLPQYHGIAIRDGGSL